MNGFTTPQIQKELLFITYPNFLLIPCAKWLLTACVSEIKEQTIMHQEKKSADHWSPNHLYSTEIKF